MTVASTTNRKSFSGDGVTTSFGTSPVVFYESTDLVVVVYSSTGVATTLTEGTDYSVTGGSSTGAAGTVNLAGGSSPYGAPAVGTTLLIRRILPLVQEADFVNNDSNDAEVSETALDKLTMIAQQISEQSGRGVNIPAVETATDALTVLPFDRASKYLAFDANKEMIASDGPAGDNVPVSAFMATVLDDTSAADARATLGAGTGDVESGPITTSGLTMSTNRMLLRTTAGTGAVEEADPVAGRAFLGISLAPGIKQGLTLSNNGTDATNDIDIAAGKAVDSTGAVVMSLTSTMVKRLDANWAAGTNQGGRYSGAAIANRTYHVWLVAKAAGADVDVYLDPSADAATVLGHLQAETGGASYLYLWRIGSIVRASGVIRQFRQWRDQFLWDALGVLDLDATSSTSAALVALTVPAGRKVKALLNVFDLNASAGTQWYISDPDVSDVAPSATAWPLGSAGSPINGAASRSQVQVTTNTSAQVRHRNTRSDSTIRIATMGWIDSEIMGA